MLNSILVVKVEWCIYYYLWFGFFELLAAFFVGSFLGGMGNESTWIFFFFTKSIHDSSASLSLKNIFFFFLFPRHRFVFCLSADFFLFPSRMLRKRFRHNRASSYNHIFKWSLDGNNYAKIVFWLKIASIEKAISDDYLNKQEIESCVREVQPSGYLNG